MTLISIIIALVVEQMHSLPMQRVVRDPVAGIAARLESKFNDGGRTHGVIAWLIGAGFPALGLLIVHLFLVATQPVLAFLLGIGVLYLTMGFRQFSHFFTDIQTALRSGELDVARRLLAQWRGVSGERLTTSEVARLSIEHALLASHRHVFAPLFWFAVLGPAGALLYRLAQLLDELWRGGTAPATVKTVDPGDMGDMGEFGTFAKQAFAWLDWLPLRLTAAAFAVVGDFEDAAHCWRTQANRWPVGGSGILLASGAGALGVRLGLPVHDEVSGMGDFGDRPELGLGDEADPEFMQSTVGLVWRSLVLGLAVLALVWVSAWVGA